MARSKAKALPNDDDDDSHVRLPCARGDTPDRFCYRFDAFAHAAVIRWHAQHGEQKNIRECIRQARKRAGGTPVLSSDTFNTQPQQHSIAFLCTSTGRHTQARQQTHRCAPSIVT